MKASAILFTLLLFFICNWSMPVAACTTTGGETTPIIMYQLPALRKDNGKIYRPRMPQAPVTNLLGMDESCFYVYPVADAMSVTINLYDEEEDLKWTCTESANDGNTVTIPYPADMNGVYIVELLLDDCAYTGRIEIE